MIREKSIFHNLREKSVFRSSWIHTSRGWGGGGGRLATFAALSLSTSRACLRAFIRLVNKREREREEEK